MHSQIPEPLRALVEQLARLPGLGPKSAMRVAMTLLKWPEAETRRLGKGIHDLRDNLHLCSRCGGLSATDPCAVCKDENRARDTLCLVNEWDSMLTLDEGGFYHGQYMILGGLLAPLANMDSDSLDLDRLISRLEEGEVHELILALGATIDAENTASFIRNLVRKRFPHIRVSRPGHPPGRGGQIHGPGDPAPVPAIPAGHLGVPVCSRREREPCPRRPFFFSCPGQRLPCAVPVPAGDLPAGAAACRSSPSRRSREGVFLTPSWPHDRRLPFRGARQAAGHAVVRRAP